MNDNPNARSPIGQPNVGIPSGDEVRYADGHKVGEVVYRFGARDNVTIDMPGWYVADGTQPDLVINGVSYGKPNLTKRVIMGADGSAGFTVGATGGSSGVPAHTHAFTQPNNHTFTHESGHGVTQPVFAGPAGHTSPFSHTNNHAGTAVAAHVIGMAEVSAAIFTPGSGIWIGYNSSLALLQSSYSHPTITQPTSHADHVFDHNHDAPARTTDVALSNGGTAGTPHSGGGVDPHAGGAVGAVTSPSSGNYPPYVAVWPLLKVF